MLGELDKELHIRGHKFVRCADDLVILYKSKRAGERIMNSAIKFIEEHLFLEVNRDKTSVVYFNRIKFLGLSFYQIKREIRFRIHPISIVKLKVKLRELTSRSNGWEMKIVKVNYHSLLKGLVNYYKYPNMLESIRRTDE